MNDVEYLRIVVSEKKGAHKMYLCLKFDLKKIEREVDG